MPNPLTGESDCRDPRRCPPRPMTILRPYRFPGRIALIGDSHCGKDEVGNWLAANAGMPFVGSTSWYLAPYVAERLGLPVETFRTAERHKYAEDMFRIGNELREADPLFLLRDVLKDRPDARVFAGLRDVREVQRGRAEGLIDQVWWVARDVPEDPTMRQFRELHPGAPWRIADFTLDNAGTKAELYERLARIAASFGAP